MAKALSRHTGLVLLSRFLQIACVVVLYFSYPLVPTLSEQIGDLMKGNGDGVAVYVTSAKLTTLLIVSCFLFVWCEIAIRTDRNRQRRMEKHATEPWLVNPAWASGTITRTKKWAVYSFIALMTLFAIYGLPAAIVFRNEKLNWVLGGLFGVTLWGYYNWYLMRFWSSAKLHLSTFPGIVGGPFTAIAQIPKKFPDETVFEAHLQCSQMMEFGFDSESAPSRQRKVLWGDTIKIARKFENKRGETWIPIHFTIPNEYPSSSNSPDEIDHVKWRLTVTVHNKIFGGEATFEVPVFRTRESSADYRADEEWTKQWTAESSPLSILSVGGYDEKIGPNNEMRIRLQHRDPFMLKVGSLLAVLTGIGLAILISCWNYGPFVWFFALICFGLLLLGVYSLIDFALWQGDLVVSKNDIQATVGLWGIRKHLAIGKELGSLRSNKYMQTERGESWEILLDNGEDSQVTIVRGVTSASEIETVKVFLCQKLELRDAGSTSTYQPRTDT